MTVKVRNRRFRPLASAVVGAIALTAMTVSATPANAQLALSFGPWGFGIGIAPPAPYYYSPFYAPYYYPRPYYYPW